jgi:putative ABC transport system permease protein
MFGHKRRIDDFDAEVESHLQLEIERLQERGLTYDQARAEAHRAFGNRTRVRERFYESGRWLFWDHLSQDIRFGLRTLRKSPGFSAVAILILSLGIGANTAIFSVINSVLLQPLPFRAPAQLVDLRETESAPGSFPLDGPDYLDWQQQNSTFESMSMYTYPRGANASGAGEAESVSAVSTQANFFETLGVQPLIGRGFVRGEDIAGKNSVAVLSYGFWQRHFGGRNDALGQQLDLDARPFTVVGVMPRWFNFPSAADIWIPADMTNPLFTNRGSHWMQAIGRVRANFSVEQARADLLTVSARINKQYRGTDTSIHSLVFPLKERLTGNSRPQLLILFGAVALVLLVACANVANLLLARATARNREIALRAALGAGRWRLIRQLLTESVILGLAGAALGLLGAQWAVSALAAANNLPIPRANPIQLDLTVLLFTVLLSVFVSILFGLAPALQTSSLDLNEELKCSATAAGGAAGKGRLLRNVLTVAEIAVSLALLVGAGLLLRSFASLRSTDIGVQPDRVLTMRLNLPETNYKTLPEMRGFFDRLLANIRQIPGVSSAAITTTLPLLGGSNGYIKVPGNTNPALLQQLVEVHSITPDYFQVFGIPLIEGRTFTFQDASDTAELMAKAGVLSKAGNGEAVKIPSGLSFAVIINQSMAKTFWPGQDALGKPFTDEGGTPYKVIGIVGDVKQNGIREKAVPERYFPLTMWMRNAGFYGTIVVKTASAQSGVLSAIRSNVRDLDSALAVYHVRTMNEVIAEAMQDTTVQAFLLAVFAALALLLAAVGLYGVMAYLVTQRTREIGIRRALGAQQTDVLRLVLAHGAKLILLGVAIGIAASLGLTRLLAALLFGVSARDPLTFTVVSVVLAAVALAACYIPARRATRVDPIVALRYE